MFGFYQKSTGKERRKDPDHWRSLAEAEGFVTKVKKYKLSELLIDIQTRLPECKSSCVNFIKEK